MQTQTQTRVVGASTKLLELVGGSIAAHSRGPEFKSRTRNPYHYQRLSDMFDISQPTQENTEFVPQIGAIARTGTLPEFTVTPSRGVLQCEVMQAALSGSK
jgi:hypothetical protein